MQETSAGVRHDFRLALVLAAASIIAIATTKLSVHVAPNATLLFCAASALTAGATRPTGATQSIRACRPA